MQTFFIAFGQRMNYSIFEPKFAEIFCECLLSKQGKQVCPKPFIWFTQIQMGAISNLQRKQKSVTNYHMLVAVTQKYYQSTSTIGYRSQQNHYS